MTAVEGLIAGHCPLNCCLVLRIAAGPVIGSQHQLLEIVVVAWAAARYSWPHFLWTILWASMKAVASSLEVRVTSVGFQVAMKTWLRPWSYS